MVPPNPTLGFTLEPGAGDKILVLIFDIPNVKGPIIEGSNSVLTLEIPKENLWWTTVMFVNYGCVEWEELAL